MSPALMSELMSSLAGFLLISVPVLGGACQGLHPWALPSWQYWKHPRLAAFRGIVRPADVW